MIESPSGLSSNMTMDLLGGWNPGGEPEIEDPRLAPPPSRPGLLEAAVGSGPRPDPGRESEREADLCLAFSLTGADGGDRLEDSTGDGSSAPRTGGPDLGQLPKAGDELGRFQIVGELGRGAFARVYLAEEKDLGHRLVALKVSKAEGDEPQLLARLQHTHIVPIHSVHDDPRTGLRLMCMPYLGGANLAEVLEAAGARLPERATGRRLVEALDRVSQRLQSRTARSLGPGISAATRTPKDTPRQCSARPARPTTQHGSISPLQSLCSHILRWGRRAPDAATGADGSELEPEQPARQFLRRADFIQAAVWIVARLAEGLDHAHSRRLLHRDLKPSNILIAGDGTPMLLDFNLAAISPQDGPEEGAKAMIGGTLPYMAPEHLDAFNPQGSTSPDAVDERADLYALGLILFEMIAGAHPFPEAPPGMPLLDLIRTMIERRREVPSLRAACPQVPWSLDAIAAKCLNPDPDRRYARARDLAEDLRRFLEDLPLKYTIEPSIRERVAKWTRRHPRACGTASISLASAALVLVLGILLGLLANNNENVSARLKYRMFQAKFDECQFLLNTSSGPTDHLDRGIALAEQTLDLQGIGKSGQWRGGSWVRRLTPAERAIVRERAVELILLEARARTILANRRGSEADQRAALEWAVTWLDRAERLDPRPPATLYADRADYLRALGQSERAARDRRRELQTPLVTSRDFALRGTEWLVRRDLDRAEVALQRAITLDLRAFWAWFALGHCHFEQDRFLEAAGDFGVCASLEPKFAWPHLNRGLALARAGQLTGALRCYDRALAANPRFVEALINRALVHLELDRPADAERDLEQAVALGRTGATVLAILGEVRARMGRRGDAERLYTDLLARDPDNPAYLVARGFVRRDADPEGARADLAHALGRDPHNARAHYGLALLERAKDPRAALNHTEAALGADPNLIDALQLRALLRARLGELSAIDDVERLIRSATPHRLYNAACALAILAETAAQPRLASRALSLLDRALEAGFPPDQVAADPDWTTLRDRPEFQDALRKAAARRPAAAR